VSVYILFFQLKLTHENLKNAKQKDFLEEGVPDIKNSLETGIFLGGGVPPCAPARRRRRSYAIPLCCPSVAKAGKFISFANAPAAALANWW